MRTSVPVEGRFDQIVLSCNASSDHSIVEIEKEAEIALDVCNLANFLRDLKIGKQK